MEPPATPSAARGTRQFGRLLLAIVVLALAVRVGYIVGAKRGPCHINRIGNIPTQCAVGDQLFYNGEANRLAHGDGFVEWAIPGHTLRPPPIILR